MKPKIAVIRGHYFSKEECYFYEPLKDDFDITFFSSIKDTASVHTSMPVVNLPCLDGILDSMSFGFFSRVYGLASNLAGIEPEFVFGLRDRLKGFDIVHSVDYDYLLTYYLSRLKRRLGFKLVTIHWENIPFARDRQPIARYFKYRTYGGIDGFLAMSERAKASLQVEGVDESRIFVTGYGVDIERFRPDSEAGQIWRKRYGIPENDTVILFVGRVRASKGIFELLYATQKLLADQAIDRHIIRLVIAGRGPGEKDVSKMVERLGLKENVLQIGYIPHGEIHNVHNMADVFCLPSVPRKYWQEQLGLVFLEAMACGKPVVSTFSGSIPEVVGDAGILVQPGDHLSLYEGLKRILVDRDLYAELKNKGRERAIQQYGATAIAGRLKKAYDSYYSMK
jgi:glycosyltransferase involved in cell wall biosynthesis